MEKSARYNSRSPHNSFPTLTNPLRSRSLSCPCAYPGSFHQTRVGQNLCLSGRYQNTLSPQRYLLCHQQRNAAAASVSQSYSGHGSLHSQAKALHKVPHDKSFQFLLLSPPLQHLHSRISLLPDDIFFWTFWPFYITLLFSS